MENARMVSQSARRYPAVQWAEPDTRPIDAATMVAAGSDVPWDALLICVAGYILTSVGRVHQLFPMLEVFHPSLVTGVLAIGIYVFDRDERRAAPLVMVPTTQYLFALL